MVSPRRNRRMRRTRTRASIAAASAAPNSPLARSASLAVASSPAAIPSSCAAADARGSSASPPIQPAHRVAAPGHDAGASLTSRAVGDPSSFGSLLAPAPTRPATTPAVLPPSEVRKFVTLVFTDLKDSTALTGSIDAEAMNEIKARYFSSMAVEIERHGGKVEKNIGDAIMAVFGLIRAHEDDALRAVRAAHGMQKVLA